MIHPNLKMLSTALVVVLSNCAFSKGAKPPADIKVYSSQPNDSYCGAGWCKGKTGAVRTQSQEVIPYSKTQDYIMMSPDHFSRLLEACPK